MRHGETTLWDCYRALVLTSVIFKIAEMSEAHSTFWLGVILCTTSSHRGHLLLGRDSMNCHRDSHTSTYILY